LSSSDQLGEPLPLRGIPRGIRGAAGRRRHEQSGAPHRLRLQAVLDLRAAEELACGALAVEAQDTRLQARDLALELAHAGAAEVDLVIPAGLLLDEVGESDAVREQLRVLGGIEPPRREAGPREDPPELVAGPRVILPQLGRTRSRRRPAEDDREPRRQEIVEHGRG